MTNNEVELISTVIFIQLRNYKFWNFNYHVNLQYKIIYKITWMNDNNFTLETN